MNTVINPPNIIRTTLIIGGGGTGSQIDDLTTVLNKTWSSQKIQTVINNAIGGVGGTGDLNYRFEKMTPSAEWVINHNLGKYPCVTVIDSAGDECEGAVVYNDINTMTLTFSGGFAGTAYLN